MIGVNGTIFAYG